MIECTRCKKPIRPDALFCPHCGLRLTRPIESAGDVVELRGQTVVPSPESFRGAQLASAVVKAFAVLWIVLGIIVMIKSHSTMQESGQSPGFQTDVILVELGVTALGASAIAFFAYVLDLLRRIERNTRSGW